MNFQYHPIIRSTAGSYFGAAMVGTFSTVIGWSFDDERLRQGLRGFSIKRSEWDNNTNELIETKWLGGYKRFKESDAGIIGDVASLTGPFQRFRWNDYTIQAGRSYRYEVFPMRGDPTNLTRDEEPLIFEFSPTPPDNGELGVYVNRGVSAAKAYFDRFGDSHPKDVEPTNAAYDWLSRGLRESLIAIIDAASPGDSLHFGVYEFFDLDIAQRIRNAANAGVSIKIVHDAKHGKHSTEKSREVVSASTLGDLESVVIERTTVNISHNKFVILLKDNQPVQVWSGTANLSENGFHYQTNSALLIRDPVLLKSYEAYFQNLTGNPSKADSKIFNTDLMVDYNDTPGTLAKKVYFSPIKRLDIVDTAAELISSAESMVLVSAPFGIHSKMAGALGQNNKVIVEYGLANATASAKIRDFRVNATRFFPPKKLNTYHNERWDAKAFGAHKIHSKLVVIDPYGPNSKVLTGSANFSKASCKDNDENAVLIEGNHRLAAIYATEFVRMFDHYKARFYIDQNEDRNKEIRRENRQRRQRGEDPLPESKIPIHLDSTDGWSRTAFDPDSNSHKFADRLAFSGRE